MAINVLIVDDSATMRMLLRKVLAIAGLPPGQCFEGANGQEALEILAREWIDLILTDVHMPEIDGQTFLQYLRQHQKWQDIPVILITSEGRPEILRHYQQLGIQGYIKKPFHPETLKRVLSGLIGETDAALPDDSEECDF